MDSTEAFVASAPERSRKGHVGIALLIVVLVAQTAAIVVLAVSVSGQETWLYQQEHAMDTVKDSISTAQDELKTVSSEISDLQSFKSSTETYKDQMDEYVTSVNAAFSSVYEALGNSQTPPIINCDPITDMYGNVTDVQCSSW